MSGWIKLYRGLTEWEWYTHIPTKTLFLHCVLRANHTEKKWRGQTINRGEFISSYSNLASETGLTVKQIRTALANLKQTNEVASHSSTQHTVFKVVNYEKYQTGASEGANEGYNERHAKGHAKGNKQECKEVKERKNIVEQGPTVEIFDFWKTKLNHPRARLDDKRKKIIHNIIKTGYTVDDCKKAIHGLTLTPHNMGQNDRNTVYDGLHIVLDPLKIDGFMSRTGGSTEKIKTIPKHGGLKHGITQ